VLLVSPHNSYRIVPYLDAARRLGVDLLLASGGSEYSLIGAVAGGLHVDLARHDRALDTLSQLAGNTRIDGVVGTDDSTVEVASTIAARLGLPHNPPHSARLARRKDLAREALRAAGVPVPAFRVLDLSAPLREQTTGIDFPCVVKPLAMSGSRGVIRADDRAQLYDACRRLRGILDSSGIEDERERTGALVEDFMPGEEVAVEGMLDDGRLGVLAVFDKPEPLDGPYFEESYYITPSRHTEHWQREIRAAVSAACAAYGLQTGPVHAELRLSGGRAMVLEVAARTIGGECARLLEYATGATLEEHVLRRALGQALPVEEPVDAGGVLMVPIPGAGYLRRVEGVLAARQVPFIEEVRITVREGYRLVPLPEGESYLGFIFARAPTAGQAEQALREAYACLNIVIAPVIETEIGRAG